MRSVKGHDGSRLQGCSLAALEPEVAGLQGQLGIEGAPARCPYAAGDAPLIRCTGPALNIRGAGILVVIDRIVATASA
eukprot:CAMPEP_0183413646 /NCGR_PEP_ID=MMETSP0370-20130417/21842_1 /TAXON_ID=268820 /ORGANISM="Peridinium aciculiferum, Strain PAER-2" /LENGTH=77 /DNA_ID=CAMNT_0025596881 /DNA_START=419 /DNA_END=652 /DNA_ORIENTATION=-